MKRTLQIGFSLAVSIVAVWYSVQGVEFGRFLEDITDARLVWVVPMVFFAIAAMLLRAWRWREILATMGRLKETPVLDATNIGFMGNMVLPLRAGEVLKPLVVARAGEVSAAAALASVALERVCDGLMLGVFAVVAVFLAPQADILADQLPALATGLVLLFVLLGVIARFAEPLEGTVDRIAGFLPGFLAGLVREGGRGGLRALAGLSEPRTFLRVMALSLLVWVAAVGGFISAALALGIEAPLLALGLATAVVIAFAVAVPSAPGFIGVFWAGAEIALGIFGVDKSMGFTFGVLNWIVQMVVICAMGVWSMGRLQLSLADLRAGTAVAGDSAQGQGGAGEGS